VTTSPRPDQGHPASFRDPAGFLYLQGGVLYRHVASRFAADYDHLLSSGLYDTLTRSGRLVPHEEVPPEPGSAAHRVLRPDPVPFVSYPYEWCFSQLRDAALLTLDLLTTGLAHGLVLKDASAYNIQFAGTRPFLVDTLSFERYREGEPWVAYRQFCEHFLAPLALGAWVDPRLSLWRTCLDGPPLDMVSSLLPFRTWLRPGLLTHLHLHARSQARHANRHVDTRRLAVSRRGLLALADSLRGTVSGLRCRETPSPWIDYERTHGYTEVSQEHKERIVASWLETARARRVWDLGANVGRFSRLAAATGAYVVALDGDAHVVDALYTRARAEAAPNILPLVMDLANPSPGLGWEGCERDSLAARAPADVALALALIHHLALGRNVPLPRIAAWLAGLAPSVIIEFVPKHDPQSQRLLRSRRDVFDGYDRVGFEAAFETHFQRVAVESLADSGRLLYWWARRP
jgi:ribosomal protein L11 methylase PrmA